MKILTYKKIEATFSEWSSIYLDVAQTVIDFINTDQCKVMHFGSTSFNVGGKGIIDLSFLYKDGELQSAVDHLLKLGFQKQMSDNPFPAERPRLDGSVEFNGKIYYLHVHVIAYGSEEHQKQVSYKAHMLTHPETRKNYELKKKKILAEGITEQESYGDHKSPFVKSILNEIKIIPSR